MPPVHAVSLELFPGSWPLAKNVLEYAGNPPYHQFTTLLILFLFFGGNLHNAFFPLVRCRARAPPAARRTDRATRAQLFYILLEPGIIWDATWRRLWGDSEAAIKARPGEGWAGPYRDPPAGPVKETTLMASHAAGRAGDSATQLLAPKPPPAFTAVFDANQKDGIITAALRGLRTDGSSQHAADEATPIAEQRRKGEAILRRVGARLLEKKT